MATIQASVVVKDDGATKVVTWAGFTAADDVGVPVEMSPWGDRCVQMTGTLGSGPQMMFEGSNSGGASDYLQLKDVHGTALSAVSTKVPLQIAEVPLYFRPRFVASSGGASIDVILILRRPNQSRQ